MPSIILHFQAESAVSLPVDDFHLRQGLVYHLMRENEELSARMHAAAPGKNTYKFFTFSPLQMERTMFHEDMMLAEGKGSFEVRSVLPEVIETLTIAAMKAETLRLGRSSVKLAGIELKDTLIRESSVNIRMRGPLVMHHTAEDRYRHYISPMEDDFSDMLNRNFQRKYETFSGKAPEGEVAIRLLRPLRPEDRYSGRFKGIIITGYYGEYELTGAPEYLTFLYHCGLGVRNAEGFGFFEPVW